MVGLDGKNLVFIFSLPRSGSTLLSNLLAGHEEICSPPEPWLLLKLLTFSKQINPFCIYDDQLAAAAINEFIDRSTIDSAAAAFAVTAYNASLQEAGKTIFIDKTPRYYYVLDEIDRIFPKAKKIFLKRNPLDIAWSCKTTWNLGPEMLTGGSVTNTFDFSFGLFKLQEYFCRPDLNRYVIDYESLVDAPEENLQKLSEFIGINFQLEMLDFRKGMNSDHKKSAMGDNKIYGTGTIHKNSKNLGISNFSKTELQTIISFIGKDIFVQLGYPQTVQTLSDMNINFGSELSIAEARKKYNQETLSLIDKCGTLPMKKMMNVAELNKSRQKLIFSAAKFINKF